MQASFTAEEASQDGIKIEEATQDRIQQLEGLVADYRATVERMEKEIEDLGGDPSTMGGARPRREILQELESEKAARTEAQQGMHSYLISTLTN